ncbi:type II toxin-antitoxin system VapC family toxin [Candidatus Saccharibacteria bacterium]|nr:type II toxin-antitoxin system VapC family toxin [Candidatus Saccharibacteria bacterium]
MILADSNIVIYSRQPGYDQLRKQLSSREVAACSVIQIEVLGWHLLEKPDEAAFEDFFKQAVNYQLDEAIIAQSIKLKRLKPGLHLPDAIIAATALVHHLELWTANAEDFSEIEGLKLHNPVQ